MPDKQLSMKSPRFVKFYKARGRKRNHHGNNNVVFELSIYNLCTSLPYFEVKLRKKLPIVTLK